MKAARIVAPLALLAAAAVVTGCQSKGATAVVPVVMAPYAAPAVTISPAPAQSGARAGANGAVQATPVAATAMNPAAAQYSPQHGPRPTTTPIAAYNIANMPVAATPVITVPTMMAPAPTPVAATPVAATPGYMPASTATMATPVMMMTPAQPQAGGGQVMYMMMAPASAAQPMAAQPMPPQPAMAQPVVAAPAAPQPAAPAAVQPQLMTLPTYGAPVYVMPQAR